MKKENNESSVHKFKSLYIAANDLMAILGADGQVTNTHPNVTQLMNALWDIDEGICDVDRVFN